ncbi:MAG TPA: c-type cytochrome [Spongiibacteraceae bacterium]|nr:c-type cytochrome [Spongiibacteraceae bacterium]
MKQLMIAALLATASAGVFAADQAVVDHFNKACTFCHTAGVSNAPKAFDAEAWKPRLAKGMDKLVASVKNGFNAMPPRGMCADCSDADYKALITYMATPKK